MAEESLKAASVQGVKHLRRVFRLLERLAPAGTERDTSGNRRLLFSHYCGLVLLGLFNPTLQSLRGLSQLSGLRRVQKVLGGKRASLGSLSESVRVFDPALMEPILEELLGALPSKARGTPASELPEELARRLVTVDGSVLKTLPQIVAAAGLAKTDWRLHLQFEVFRQVPRKMMVTENGVGGKADERSVLAGMLEKGKTYVMDAGYERYALLEQITLAGSDYVCRVQRRQVEVIRQYELSEDAIAANVVTDELVQLGRSRSDVTAVTHKVRRIVINADHYPRRRRTDRKQSNLIVLLTNLLDVPAEVVAAIYRMRWMIELFFRFFKHILGCKELISLKEEGIAIQVYCALIASLLITLAAGQSVGRRGFELICLYFQGWAMEDELIAGLEKLTRAQKKPLAK